MFRHLALISLCALTLMVPSGLASADAASPSAVSDPDVEPPVTPADFTIIARAREILNSEDAWNRADNRICPTDAKKFSLYCALQRATLDVNGSFSHRGSAMQQARFVVDDLTSDRDYKHRLMDYNNDPTTTLADIRHVLDLTEARIKYKLKAL